MLHALEDAQTSLFLWLRTRIKLYDAARAASKLRSQKCHLHSIARAELIRYQGCALNIASQTTRWVNPRAMIYTFLGPLSY